MEICIVGNSKRTEILRKNLENTEHHLLSIRSLDDLQKNYSADYTVLPVPTLNTKGFINISGEKTITAENFIKLFNKKTKFISCNFQNENFNIIDLNTREDFAFLNAVPTAEGAIYYALNNTEKSLFESEVLVTGFGRVAMILADRLKGLGCNVTVTARNIKALSHAYSMGYNTVNLQRIHEVFQRFDIIFQTIPSLVLTEKVISQAKENCVIIELSSQSLGTDCNYAISHNVKVVHAPALPEKISPITAGNILTKCVLSIISEHQ